MQKNDISFLIRRLALAPLIILIGYGVSVLLAAFDYPKMTLFAIISGVVLIGTILNIINHLTTFFYEELDSLVIKRGLRGKAHCIPYQTIIKCTVREGLFDKIFKTKQVIIHYPDYKGIQLNETLGLKSSDAERLAAHINNRHNGESTEFPKA